MKSFQSNSVFILVDYEKENEWSPAAGPRIPEGRYLIIWPKFPENCMKMKKKLDQEGVASKLYYADPPLVSASVSVVIWVCNHLAPIWYHPTDICGNSQELGVCLGLGVGVGRCEHTVKQCHMFNILPPII